MHTHKSALLIEEEAQMLGRERQEEVHEEKEDAAVQAGLTAGLATGERTFDAAARGGNLPRRAVLLLAALLVAFLTVASRAEAFVYWGDGGQIGRADLDGSNVDRSFITGVEPTCGMAVDGQHLYWARWGPAGGIGRANLDGTGADNRFISVADSARGLAVDGAHLYWTNWHWPDVSGTIGRADLDGSNVDESFIALAAQPIEVAVAGGHIYWTGGGTIGRADLDGSDVDPNFIDSETFAFGLAVNGTHIFWTSNSEGRIGRANLNGTGVDESFITFGVDIPGWEQPSEVDVDGAHVYWANQVGFYSGYPRIGRADLDGSNVDEFFIHAYFPCGLAVDALSTPPPPASPATPASGFNQKAAIKKCKGKHPKGSKKLKKCVKKAKRRSNTVATSIRGRGQ